MTLAALFCLTFAITGCGGMVVFGADDGNGGSGIGGSPQGGSGDGASDPTGGSTSSMTGTSNIVPTIVSLGFGADCMPMVGPDPVFGSVFIDYDNQGTGNGNMNIVQAELVFVNAMEGWVFPIQLSPTASGSVAPSPPILTSEHVKVATPGDSSFICQLCGQSGELSLRFVDDQGSEASATQPFDLGCAL